MRLLRRDIRYYTHGCDFWAPPEAVAYHLWSRDHRPTFSGAASRRQADVAARQRLASTARVRRMLCGEDVDGDPFGLGRERTLEQFEESVNVSMKRQEVAVDADLAGLSRTRFESSSGDMIAACILDLIGSNDSEVLSPPSSAKRKVGVSNNNFRANGNLSVSGGSKSDTAIAALSLVKEYLAAHK
jgi:hypothetical protein